MHNIKLVIPGARIKHNYVKRRGYLLFVGNPLNLLLEESQKEKTCRPRDAVPALDWLTLTLGHQLSFASVPRALHECGVQGEPRERIRRVVALRLGNCMPRQTQPTASPAGLDACD